MFCSHSVLAAAVVALRFAGVAVEALGEVRCFFLKPLKTHHAFSRCGRRDNVGGRGRSDLHRMLQVDAWELANHYMDLHAVCQIHDMDAGSLCCLCIDLVRLDDLRGLHEDWGCVVLLVLRRSVRKRDIPPAWIRSERCIDQSDAAEGVESAFYRSCWCYDCVQGESCSALSTKA